MRMSNYIVIFGLIFICLFSGEYIRERDLSVRFAEKKILNRQQDRIAEDIMMDTEVTERNGFLITDDEKLEENRKKLISLSYDMSDEVSDLGRDRYERADIYSRKWVLSEEQDTAESRQVETDIKESLAFGTDVVLPEGEHDTYSRSVSSHQYISVFAPADPLDLNPEYSETEISGARIMKK